MHVYWWLHNLRYLHIFLHKYMCVHTCTYVFMSSIHHDHTCTQTHVCSDALPTMLPLALPTGLDPTCLFFSGGEYFSDEQMRFRAPLLYEQYIGQYLTQEELSARAPAHQLPKPHSPGSPACPLSDLLLQSYQERELQQRLLQQQEEEEACLEEEEEEEDSDEGGKGQQLALSGWAPQCPDTPALGVSPFHGTRLGPTSKSRH